MSGVCITLGATLLALLPAGQFTLSWTHSIEKTAWHEDWRATADGLRLVEMRVKGSGAGMEPGPGAVFENGFWLTRPDRPPLSRLRLARSGFAGDYVLCIADACLALESLAPADRTDAVWEIFPCAGP